jgi:hypothetical protein
MEIINFLVIISVVVVLTIMRGMHEDKSQRRSVRG